MDRDTPLRGVARGVCQTSLSEVRRQGAAADRSHPLRSRKSLTRAGNFAEMPRIMVGTPEIR